ncbi:hypothetical protein XarjCFBP1022_12050 [Xanthomonas arboricola]|nr:hypothetical protein XarbCFBP8149_10710 [Xanthomonas arboricola]PPU11396.1 hypothetical protein XarjCFBP1022_12050 [Xanthomonas arboricola]
MRYERHAASALTPRSVANLVFGRDALQAAMHCIDLPAQRRTTGAMQQRMLRLGRARVWMCCSLRRQWAAIKMVDAHGLMKPAHQPLACVDRLCLAWIPQPL